MRERELIGPEDKRITIVLRTLLGLVVVGGREDTSRSRGTTETSENPRLGCYCHYTQAVGLLDLVLCWYGLKTTLSMKPVGVLRRSYILRTDVPTRLAYYYLLVLRGLFISLSLKRTRINKTHLSNYYMYMTCSTP